MSQTSFSMMGQQVLVIEDDRDNAELLRCILCHYGATVVVARDGRQALDALDKQSFGLLLCDIAMPRLDGWELIAQIKHHPRLAQVPIIAISAHALREDEQRALKVGFSAYVVKPITSVAALVEAIQQVV